jgi:hypothetical protein
MALAYTLCEALRHKVLLREYGEIVRAPTLTSLKDGGHQKSCSRQGRRIWKVSGRLRHKDAGLGG